MTLVRQKQFPWVLVVLPRRLHRQRVQVVLIQHLERRERLLLLMVEVEEDAIRLMAHTVAVGVVEPNLLAHKPQQLLAQTVVVREGGSLLLQQQPIELGREAQ
jgi:hypothetical protein